MLVSIYHVVGKLKPSPLASHWEYEHPQLRPALRENHRIEGTGGERRQRINGYPLVNIQKTMENHHF